MKCFLLVFVILAANAQPDKKPVRKVTIFPLSLNVSVNQTHYTGGIADAGVSPYNVLYMMDVGVSDDPGKTYSVSCFVYHSWNHCDLPKADSYDAEIQGNVMRIVAKRDKKGKVVDVAKYHIDFIAPVTSPQPY